MTEPRCEDLRLGERIGGIHVHSPLAQGPFFRVYGAEGEGLEWNVYAWEKLPPPEEEAIARFRERAEKLMALNEPGIVPVRGPFTFRDGSLGWAVAQPSGVSIKDLLAQKRLRASRLVPALSSIARALHRAAEAGVLHPDLRPESLIVSPEEPRGQVMGFFSWRKLSSSLAGRLGPEAASPYQAPEGAMSEASLSFSLAKIGKEAGLSSVETEAALQEDPAARPGLLQLAGMFDKLRPGFLARLFGG